MTTEAASNVSNQSERALSDTHQKALAVNLDATSFGSFAEIGAGQEVAQWFLRVGGASGTVAKTVSAYDKEVSDDLYGSGTRYVSKPRVQAMLEHEWKSLIHQVGQESPDGRGKTTRFFAFANTIAARNFAGTNDCHGWIGVRFQHRPQAEASEILLHVNLRDNANVLQQEAVGILGVNLLHALLNEKAVGQAIAARLFDNLDTGRIEIDQIELHGGAFQACDVRAIHEALARDGHAEAITITPDGSALAANEFLYKQAMVIAPAAVDVSEEMSAEALEACVEALQREVAGNPDVKGVINARLVFVDADAPLQSAGSELNGRSALVTRNRPLYRTTAFVRRYSRAPLRFAVTLPAVMRIFDEAREQHLEGRLLDGIARLFGHDVRVLASPSRRGDMERLLKTEFGRAWAIDGDGEWVTAAELHPQPPLRHLYDYLLTTGFLVPTPL